MPPFLLSAFLQSGPGCWWCGSLPVVPVVAGSSRRHHGAWGRGCGVLVFLSPWCGDSSAVGAGAPIITSKSINH